MMDNDILETAKKAVDILKSNNITISSAESCTGGLFSATLSAIPGISSIFELGIISYSNKVKSDILGVPEKIIAEHGAISKSTAKYMAMQVRKLARSSLGVSVTGVAGPDASEGKAPGTVYIALADDSSVIIEKLNINPVSREFIREWAVNSMFELIQKYLDKKDSK